MAKVDVIKAARKDYEAEGIKKGETYYSWQLYNGPLMRSKTYPTRSQLTGSAFLKQIYDIEDKISAFSCEDFPGVEDFIEEVKGELETLKEENESNLENIPEQLKDTGSAGILLTERIDELDNMISELEGIDVPNEDDFKTNAKWKEEDADWEFTEGEEEEEVNESGEKKLEKLDEVIAEVNEITYSGN